MVYGTYYTLEQEEKKYNQKMTVNVICLIYRDCFTRLVRLFFGLLDRIGPKQGTSNGF